VRVGSKEDRQVVSIVKPGKGRAKGSCDSNKRDNSSGAEKTILNSLIIGVTFGEIVLSGLGTSMETMSVITILNGLKSWQQHAYNLDSCIT